MALSGQAMKTYCVITKGDVRIKIKAERFPDLKVPFFSFQRQEGGIYAQVAIDQVVAIFDEEDGEEMGPEPLT
jgi:hypothetical protein